MVGTSIHQIVLLNIINMDPDFQFYHPEQKNFGQTIQQYPGQGKSIEEHSVVFSGFPYDQGTRRNGGRIGGSVASTIFRKTLNQLQLYPSQKIAIYDAGDIETQLELEQAHIELEKKHSAILGRQEKPLLVAIGGSNDQSFPNVSALLSHYPNKVAVINIDSHFDVRPLKEGKAHSGSPFRQLLESPHFLANGGVFVEFANKGATCSQSHTEYLNEKKCEIYWLEKVIRRHKVESQGKWRTQAGQVFANLMNKLEQQCNTIFVSFDVDSISSMWMPGVSAPSVIGGLTSEEALEIVEIAGLCSKVKLVDFSQFNPAVESIMSGHLLGQLFFALCMSYAQRPLKPTSI